MKNITIVGASAGMGLETLTISLEAGHKVTTLLCSKGNLPTRQNLTVVQGSVTNEADVMKAITGADAILVTIGTGTKIEWQTIAKGINPTPDLLPLNWASIE